MLSVFFEAAWQNRALFFHVLPRDCLSHLDFFLRPLVGRIRNPLALCYCSSTPPIRPSACARRMCFDIRNNLVCPMPSINEVHVYDVEGGGKLLRRVAEGQHDCPVACATDSKQRIYVTEFHEMRVRVFSADDTCEKFFDVVNPLGLALDLSEELLYVCSHDSHSAIKVFRISDCSEIREIGRETLECPDSVVVLSTGQVAVSCNTYIGDLHLFNCDGTHVWSIKQKLLMYPRQVAIDAKDNFYVTNNAKNEICVISVDCGLVRRFDTCDGIGGAFSYLNGIAISRTGMVAVSNHSGPPYIKFYSCE